MGRYNSFRPGKVWHWGVRCYTSEELYNWEDKGLIIPPQPDDLQSPLHPTYCMDRPHIIYCEKTGKYVAWLKINPQWWVKPMARQVLSGMKRHFRDYQPDPSPRTANPLPGTEIRHKENTSISRYVWLPVEWEGEKPVIRWKAEWRI